MQLSREEIIQFILKHNSASKKEELEKLSLTSLVIIKTQLEILKKNLKTIYQTLKHNLQNQTQD